MATRIYVGRLPYATTDEELKEVFAAHGEVVSAKIIMDRDTNRSKGFGFVEMANDEEAATAIKQLNDTEVGGRRIAVSEARPMTERPPRQY